MLLKEPALHLVKDEAHSEAGEQAQTDAHIRRLLTGIHAVVEHGDEGGQGGLVHGRDEGQISHDEVEGRGTRSCRPVLLPGLYTRAIGMRRSSLEESQKYAETSFAAQVRFHT